jgi:hypothetical protein
MNQSFQRPWSGICGAGEQFFILTAQNVTCHQYKGRAKGDGSFTRKI